MNNKSCRKVPLDTISFIMDEDPDLIDVTGNKQRLAMVIRGLEQEDPNSVFALAARWRLKSVLATEAVKGNPSVDISKALSSMPDATAKALLMANMSAVFTECSRQLEELLEKRAVLNGEFGC